MTQAFLTDALSGSWGVLWTSRWTPPGRRYTLSSAAEWPSPAGQCRGQRRLGDDSSEWPM